MRLLCATKLFLANAITTISAIENFHAFTQPTLSTSSVSSLASRHAGYVDQRVRQDPYTFLNHEFWQQRNVIPTAPDASLGPSNITSDAIEMDEAFLLPDDSPMDNSTNASSSNSAARLTDLPMLLQSTTALEEDIESDATWDNQTEAACVIAVSTLHGIASNPTGLAACYNIRSFSNITGRFGADLRVYQIAAPSGNWTHLQPSSEMLDVVYSAARIAESSRIQKRESAMLPLHLFQKVETNHRHFKRANHAPPRRLQGLTLSGNVEDSVAIASLNE